MKRIPSHLRLAALPILLLGAAAPAAAQLNTEGGVDLSADGGPIDMTLERMVEYALETSYRVRHLNINIERTRLNLEASRAQLRSRVDLDFELPTINYVSETRWDSDLARSVIQRENSRRMEAELSIRQPVILFGYPTNGYLSLNNRIYRLTQVEGDITDVRYYNRAFVSYTQPLFQTNQLKNEIEEAELDFESQELDFYGDIANIIDNMADEYFQLFRIAYQRQIRSRFVNTLEEALNVAEEVVANDPDREIDMDQIQVELGNAVEDLNASDSRFRLETASLKTEFGIAQERQLRIDPVIDLQRITIDVDRATEFALELTPRMRQLGIQHRESEIRLDNARGRGGFEMDVSVSYGREMQNEVFNDIWGQPENSYTVDVEGSIPLWDWGARDKRIRADELSVEQSLLRIEERTADIESDVLNEVRNVEEYENRAFNMQANLELSRQITARTMEQYRNGDISAVDLLQTLRREVDTAENFLDVYLGWRGALQDLQDLTYYDWQNQMRLMDRFGISFEGGVGS